MSRWHAELACMVRYVSGGILCTALGFAVIFIAVYMGVPAFAANAAGYGFGLLIGFVFNRKVVFRSTSSVQRQLVRYLGAFGVAYCLNLVTLYLLLEIGDVTVMMAQAGAAVVYTAAMYLLSRFYTFGTSGPRSAAPRGQCPAIPASARDAVE